MDWGWCDRSCSRSSRLVRSPDPSRQNAVVVGARDRASERNAGHSLDSRLGPLARPRAVAALSSGLCPISVARLVGFWLGRLGRYGDSQSRAGLLRFETWRAGE